MSAWEPFTGQGRRAIVRAQEIAQMFGSHFIGTEHIAFALAEGDGEVGRLLATAVDRDAMRERLGGVATAPTTEMVFTPGAKQTIELAFENARRLNHATIGEAHLALGVLGSGDRPPLVHGADIDALRTALERVAASDVDVPPGEFERLGGSEPESAALWTRTAGDDDPHLAAVGIVRMLACFPDLSRSGTSVTVTITPLDGPERTWSYRREEQR